MKKIVARDRDIEVVHFCCRLCPALRGLWCEHWKREIKDTDTTYCDPGRANHIVR